MKNIWLCLVAALLLAAIQPARASADHVLVLAISEYHQKPLAGVKFDAKSGVEIARAMGYDVSRAKVLRDEQLRNAEGFKSALATLVREVAPGDRVFLYYSGHGASERRGNQCVQSLVAQDGQLVEVDYLIQQLSSLKEKTTDVFVLVDACHSGGLRDVAVTRSVASSQNPNSPPSLKEVVAKAWIPKDGETCAEVVNAAKSFLHAPDVAGTRSTVMPTNNFLFFAAANERELALDDPGRGGLATTSILDCLRSGVADTDGSGAVSARELAACATERVAKESPKLTTKYKAHTVEVYGNGARAVSAKPVKVSMSASDESKRVLASFAQIEAGSNPNWAVTVQAPERVRMSMNSDCASGGAGTGKANCAAIHYSTSQTGFLTIYYVGSDGKHLAVITDEPIEVRATSNAFLGNIPIVDCPEKACPGTNTFLFLFTNERPKQEAILKQARESGKILVSDNLLANLACVARQSGGSRNALSLQANVTCAASDASPQTGGATGRSGVAGYGARMVKIDGY